MKSKKLKREEAEERQKRYDNLDIHEKMAQLITRPGESKREAARLLKEKEKKNDQPKLRRKRKGTKA